MDTFKVIGRTYTKEDERAALIKTERALRNISPMLFNMRVCTSCVGHHVGRRMGLTYTESEEYVKSFSYMRSTILHKETTRRFDDDLRRLYYPEFVTRMNIPPKIYRDPNPNDAADAVARYLLGGDPWPDNWWKDELEVAGEGAAT